jgi:hypothetical protein
MVTSKEEESWYAVNRFGTLRITQRQILDVATRQHPKNPPAKGMRSAVQDGNDCEPVLAAPFCPTSLPEHRLGSNVAVSSTTVTTTSPARMTRSASHPTNMFRRGPETPATSTTSPHSVSPPERSVSHGTFASTAANSSSQVHRQGFQQAKTFVRKFLLPTSTDRSGTEANITTRASQFKVRLEAEMHSKFIWF